MAHTLTADQSTALAYEDQDLVQGVKIGLTTPVYYCTGDIPVTLASNTYTPRGMTVGSIPVGPSKSSRASVRLADQDSILAAKWFAERFTGVIVTITEAIMKEGVWVVTKTVPWVCTGVVRSSNGDFTMSLSGAGGMKPRAGLKMGSRIDFPFAPEPGTIIRLYDGQVTVE
jgi:hypothetical protein